MRTNLFDPEKKKQEIINRVEQNKPRRYQEWGDFKMKKTSGESYNIEIPVSTVGFFEAKAYFIPEGEKEPLWPGGENLQIKVEPAGSVISNSIYSAFVRLFIDQDKLNKIKSNLESQSIIKDEAFNVIPESGKFKDLINQLDFIIGEMGFDIIMLLPVHPVPTTYARMGLFGSPYATLDYYNVDAALAEFDKETTPLEQFSELVDAVHARNARIFLDIPANHTGWASQLQIHHPEYFVKDEEGRFISPGAWGVTWNDLSELDYSKKGLWEYMANVFLFWCKKGVDGFRCDAGYMIPAEAWKYITSKVRDEYPSAIFLLEGLGGRISTTEKLLTDSNLNWAYSEMFQNYDQNQMERYIEEFSKISFEKGPLVNFSETHDNNRLASVSREFSRLRNGLTALLSDTGTFAATCGVEWFADEKIDVHRLTSMNWGNKENQVEYIKLLNTILKKNPVFHHKSKLTKMHTSQNNSIAYLREVDESDEKLAVIANLHNQKNAVYLEKNMAMPFKESNTDILSGENIPFIDNGNDYKIELEAYQILAFSGNKNFLKELNSEDINHSAHSIKAERLLRLQLIKLFKSKNEELTQKFIEEKVKEFKESPYTFFYSNFNSRPPVIKWTYPMDIKRQVVVPRNTPVIIQVPHHFRYHVKNRSKTIDTGEGFFLKENLFVSLFHPGILKNKDQEITIHIDIFQNNGIQKDCGKLLIAAQDALFDNKNEFNSDEIKEDQNLSALSVNNRSGYSLVRGYFSSLQSKYDALIAANLNPELPEDKHIMLSRFRGWSVYKGFSREIITEYQRLFEHYRNTTEYYFEMPAGGGYLIPLTLTFKFDEHGNMLTLKVKRLINKELPLPPSDQEVKIILRPDIESRNYHELTKAFKGPEEKWPKNIKHRKQDFIFQDNDKSLRVGITNGTFIREDEWQYMIARPVEKERGMDGDSDLFSPGYFKILLKANEEAIIYASIRLRKEDAPGDKPFTLESDIKALPEIQDIRKVLKNSLREFIVNRNSNKTVIAGYPWFLDWGRDTLICLRGIIASGYINESKSIIKEFASYEKKGTLPNIIRGKDTSNRDTSDAPLWLFAAVHDIIEKEGISFLETDCNGRSLKEVLKSIASHYINGTPNGIKMDKESGLVFSPTHFTWMDTNYPAGTPREGYPIEIQALWYHAINLLSKIFPEENQWKKLATQIKHSIPQYFLVEKEAHSSISGIETYLSDCLHTKGFQPAWEAEKDDHIRPNQLFAITFLAVSDTTLCGEILSVCEELLIPGAIRTLADRHTKYKLPVFQGDKLLNNPGHPYRGEYTGDEDTSRKPAYHNGTAWTWPFPSYCEALTQTYKEKALQKARDILSTSIKLLNEGCINQIPEILDGNYPHRQKGCYAQAWGITELYRVADKLGMLE